MHAWKDTFMVLSLERSVLTGMVKEDLWGLNKALEQGKNV